jgi:DNA polymerase III delta prime subunit
MSLLSKIERGKMPKPPRILLYGPEGIGKTTFGSQAPSPMFVQTEDGADLIEADKFPLAQRYEDVAQALGDLLVEPHDYETVVLDSADWLERCIHDRVCADTGARSIEKADGGYARGYLLALNYWREILEQLKRLRDQRNMIIVLIAHAKVERFEDPEAPPYDRYSPRLHKHASALITEWCDAVLFATRKFRTASEDAGFGRKRTIAHAIGKDGGERILRTVGGPSCLAKNRYGLTEELPLSWAAFMAALTHREAGD